MYESPRLVSVSSVNAAYGYGGLTMGACVVNINLVANVNVGANALAAANVGVGVNAAAAANAVAVILVCNHYCALGALDPRTAEDAERDRTRRARIAAESSAPPLAS